MYIHAIQANITQLEVDAIVNAANSSLLGGSGVDGAIHRAAGSGLVQECRLLGHCKPGDAKLTRGYRLPARYIIHTVGPVWRGGAHKEDQVLRSCYRRSLEIAVENNIRSIAFPSISTGTYGYPIELAAPAAIDTVYAFVNDSPELEEVVFCCFSDADLEIYQNALARVAA